MGDLQDPAGRASDQEVRRRHDTTRRVADQDGVTVQGKNILADTYTALNPADIQRKIQALSTQLLTLTTGKTAADAKPIVRGAPANTRLASTAEPVAS